MAKPKAPRWLTEAFRDGVDERETVEVRGERRYYGCWLAQFDPLERSCDGPLERAHCIKRERVENALAALLPAAGTYIGPEDGWVFDPVDLILSAAWDPRNARIGCAHQHHPRFDSKQTPTLIVPRSALPDHVEEFAADWGLESELERKFA